jgi:subtilase family serine protease
LTRYGRSLPIDQYQTFADGGTSLASPLVAGMLADAEQGQPARLGGGAYLLSIFDSQRPAYTDQVTGLGTPNGAAFISSLRHGSTR